MSNQTSGTRNTTGLKKQTNASKLCFIDVETCGLNPLKNPLLQVAGEIYEDGVLTRKFNFRVKPFLRSVINTNKKFAQKNIKNSQIFTDKQAYEYLVSILNEHVNKFNKKDKMYFVGYFVQHDFAFIKQLFKRNKDMYFGSYFYRNPLDVMQIALNHTLVNNGRKEFDDFSLSTVAKEYGIAVNNKKLHDAKYDIATTRRLWNKVQPSILRLYQN